MSHEPPSRRCQQMCQSLQPVTGRSTVGTGFFINVIYQIQHDVFKPMYWTAILPNTQKLARPIDRKIAVASFIKALGVSQVVVDTYPNGWTFTSQCLVQLLVNPPIPTTTDNGELSERGRCEFSFSCCYISRLDHRVPNLELWQRAVESVVELLLLHTFTFPWCGDVWLCGPKSAWDEAAPVMVWCDKCTRSGASCPIPRFTVERSSSSQSSVRILR